MGLIFLQKFLHRFLEDFWQKCEEGKIRLRSTFGGRNYSCLKLPNEFHWKHSGQESSQVYHVSFTTTAVWRLMFKTIRKERER